MQSNVFFSFASILRLLIWYALYHSKRIEWNETYNTPFLYGLHLCINRIVIILWWKTMVNIWNGLGELLRLVYDSRSLNHKIRINCLSLHCLIKSIHVSNVNSNLICSSKREIIRTTNSVGSGKNKYFTDLPSIPQILISRNLNLHLKKKFHHA